MLHLQKTHNPLSSNVFVAHFRVDFSLDWSCYVARCDCWNLQLIDLLHPHEIQIHRYHLSSCLNYFRSRSVWPEVALPLQGFCLNCVSAWEIGGRAVKRVTYVKNTRFFNVPFFWNIPAVSIIFNMLNFEVYSLKSSLFAKWVGLKDTQFTNLSNDNHNLQHLQFSKGIW